MSGILDSNGRATTSYKLVNASNRATRSTPWVPDFAKDFDTMFTPCDWRTVLSGSRQVVQNNGIVRGAILQKANAVVGRAWKPEFKGKDKDFGLVALEWLKSWYQVCDVRGNMYDFVSNLWRDCVALDKDGGGFVLLTETKDGYPQLQHILAHQVGTRGYYKVIPSGKKYAGLTIRNGVIENKAGAPVAYYILGETEADDEIIDAQNIIPIADPEWHDQGRGMPTTSHGIAEIRKAEKSSAHEQMAQEMLSSYAVIEYNETGGVDPDDPTVSFQESSDGGDPFAVQTYSEGMVRHFKSNSGGKVESISHNRPGDMWDSFQDRIYRSFLGPIWPYELSWKKEGINGTTIRNIQANARSMTERRQEVLLRPALRMISWAIAKAIKIGQLPPSEDWYKWGFTMPAKVSIDPGRDSKALINEYHSGFSNMEEIQQEKGKTLKEHWIQRCSEIVERDMIKAEFENKFKIVIDPRELQMYTPNDGPKDEETTTTESNEDE